MDFDKLMPVLYAKGLDIGTKLLGLIVLWIIGRFVIRAIWRLWAECHSPVNPALAAVA